MPRTPLGGKAVNPKDFCSIEQAVEIALRISRRELLLAAGRNPDAPYFEAFINGPANADAIPFIEIMVEEYVKRQRWSVRVRTWFDLHMPRPRVRR